MVAQMDDPIVLDWATEDLYALKIVFEGESATAVIPLEAIGAAPTYK